MLQFLPPAVLGALRHLNSKEIYELRLRADRPVSVNFRGKYFFLSPYGLTERAGDGLCCTLEEIEKSVQRAGKFSVYSVEEQIKRGFITAENGERIGICGEYVFENGQPLSVRKITSLCVRIPHEIKGCSEVVWRLCCDGGIKNTLILSLPGQGKTTLLRDLARKIADGQGKNVLICDERGELSSGELGSCTDVLTYADKAFAFEAGLRAMRPDVIITDELADRDLSAVQGVIRSGVKMLASAHFSDFQELPASFKTFERYALLDGDEVGRVTAVYAKNGEILYNG